MWRVGTTQADSSDSRLHPTWRRHCFPPFPMLSEFHDRCSSWDGVTSAPSVVTHLDSIRCNSEVCGGANVGSLHFRFPLTCKRSLSLSVCTPSIWGRLFMMLISPHNLSFGRIKGLWPATYCCRINVSQASCMVSIICTSGPRCNFSIWGWSQQHNRKKHFHDKL